MPVIPSKAACAHRGCSREVVVGRAGGSGSWEPLCAEHFAELGRRKLGDNPLDAALVWVVLMSATIITLGILAVTVKPCWLVVPC